MFELDLDQIDRDIAKSDYVLEQARQRSASEVVYRDNEDAMVEQSNGAPVLDDATQRRWDNWCRRLITEQLNERLDVFGNRMAKHVNERQEELFDLIDVLQAELAKQREQIAVLQAVQRGEVAPMRKPDAA